MLLSSLCYITAQCLQAPTPYPLINYVLQNMKHYWWLSKMIQKISIQILQARNVYESQKIPTWKRLHQSDSSFSPPLFPSSPPPLVPPPPHPWDSSSVVFPSEQSGKCQWKCKEGPSSKKPLSPLICNPNQIAGQTSYWRSWSPIFPPPPCLPSSFLTFPFLGWLFLLQCLLTLREKLLKSSNDKTLH